MSATLKGNEAEALFVYEATKRFVKVAQPLFIEVYDYIVDNGLNTYKIQVKYVNKKRNEGYRLHLVSSCRNRKYSAYDVDFFLAYLKGPDVWYVFPVSILEQATYLSLKPQDKNCKYSKYLEAWDLIQSGKPTT